MLFRDFSYELTHLRVAPNKGGAPHKPVLILTIMDCIDRGIITTNKIQYTDELKEVFNEKWNEWVDTTHKNLLYLPFFHMKSEGFWTLVPKKGREIPVTSKGSVRSEKALRENLEYALMDEELFFALCDPSERMHLKILLVNRYFPNILIKENPFVRMLEEVKIEILNEPPTVYRKRMKKLEKLKKGTLKKTYSTDRVVRNTTFGEVIKEIYDFRCCISGMHVFWEDNNFLLDACHIIPFSTSYDDTVGNGIPLCPNLHRAFDNGLITIDESKFKVIVSKEFTEDESCIYSLKQFENAPIKLPEKAEYYPLQENLLWHRENVFRR